MNRIVKYIVSSEAVIKKHEGAKLLDVQIQNGCTCIWAVADVLAKEVATQLVVVGTGWEVSERTGEYIGTVQQGDFVWHYFTEGAA